MSNAEKRSVSTDALETLGNLIGPNEKRDAIHLAVIPVMAAQNLHAGDDICVTSDGKASHGPNPVGIVDPFLKETVVKKGQHFWLIIYPRKITSLRHVWSHPSFPEEPVQSGISNEEKFQEVEDALDGRLSGKKWLANYASSLGVSYTDLLNRASAYQEHGAYWSEGSRFEGESVPPEFWDHYEKVTGEVVNDPGNFFSCSC